MKIAVIQMNTTADKAVNLAHMAELMDRARETGADLAVLPEMFPCLYTNRSFLANAECAGESIWQALSEAARKTGMYLIGGSFPEREGERIYNTSFVFDRSSTQIARHRKVHLFDVNFEGGQRFQESRTFTPGDDITVFDTEFGKLGLCICFDMRFPELARIMALEGAQVLFVPASFNMTTGPKHWELMFRSRAVDNQVFTVGCAPARDENGPYVSYANSIVVDPMGQVLARAGAEETILTVDLDLTEIAHTRAQLPLMPARRTDLYTIGRK